MRKRINTASVLAVLLLLASILLLSGLAGPLPAASSAPADGPVGETSLQVQTDQREALQDCSIRYALSPTSGSVIPGGSRTATFTAEWQVGPCTWTVDLSASAPAGITVGFEPASGQVSAENTTWTSTATMIASPTATPGTYDIQVYVDALANGQQRPRKTFTYTLSVAATTTGTPTATVTPGPSPTPTATPTGIATPTAWVYLPLVMRSQQPIPILFADDFSSPGWPEQTVSNGEIGYADGEYRTFAKAGVNRAVAGGPGENFVDFDLEISVRVIESTFDGAYLLLFRYQSNEAGDQYYCVTVSPSRGSYRLCKGTGGVWPPQTLATGESEAIQAGTASNRLRIVADGSTIRLYVNDQFLHQVVDSSFATGTLLVGAWNYSGDHPLTIYWDNVVVYRAGDRPTSAGTLEQPQTFSRPQ